ncbi:MAG: hypothetical protein KGL57_13235, partial [Burkholderiales bacterium]|nr:hypothetical protein [Burkholderiales bacterium]
QLPVFHNPSQRTGRIGIDLVHPFTPSSVCFDNAARLGPAPRTTLHCNMESVHRLRIKKPENNMKKGPSFARSKRGPVLSPY